MNNLTPKPPKTYEFRMCQGEGLPVTAHMLWVHNTEHAWWVFVQLISRLDLNRRGCWATAEETSRPDEGRKPVKLSTRIL